MAKSIKLFVGMDVHKDSIDVATAEERGGEVRHYGAIGGELAAVTRLARKLESAGGPLVFVQSEGGEISFAISGEFRIAADNKIIVAIARELSGFVWALGQVVKPA